MRRAVLTNNSTIRFNRWSRAKYAVFRSLSKQINIGHLRVSIADMSLLKITAIAPNTTIDCFNTTEDKKEELEEYYQPNGLFSIIKQAELFAQVVSIQQQKEKSTVLANNLPCIKQCGYNESTHSFYPHSYLKKHLK